MRIFLLSSVFIFLGCTHKTSNSLIQTSSKNTCLNTLQPVFQTVLYNTVVNVTDHHITGILLMKKMNGDTTRVVFTNEMGVTFFDFEFTATGFRVISCIRKLNRKPIINQLKKNFQLILMADPNISQYQLISANTETLYRLEGKKEQTYYVTDTACSKVLRIETADNQAKKIIIRLDGEINGIARDISIKYQTFNFNISLKQIEK